MRKGFTLIEVMVSVVIISVVIGALLQIFSNNTHFFSQFKSKIDLAWRSSLLLYQDEIGGFKEKKDDEIEEDIFLDELVKKFNIDDDLRRELKKIEADVTYKAVSIIETDEMEMDVNESDQELATQYEEAKEKSDGVVLEIGKTSFKIGDESTTFLRLNLE